MTIPSNVKSIGILAFGDCYNMKNISIPADHLNRIRNRDIFLVSTIPYKRTSLHFKIGLTPHLRPATAFTLSGSCLSAWHVYPLSSLCRRMAEW